MLAAEVAAGRRLIERLDPRSTRVGVVTFAGEPAGQGLVIGRASAAAVTEVPLTADYDEVQRGLDRILSRGPYGMTHMAAGVDQATIELRGLRGAYSQADAESEKVVLFLTDGQPTLPYGIEFAQANTQAVLRAADRARKAGVRVYSFGIGEEALAGPLAIVRLADITGGPSRRFAIRRTSARSSPRSTSPTSTE
ncbi:MAG: VWA domain-containing protein [Myxococcota bacterium]|nr:VWA domain-containing protein [Myxococcota bacterium]